MQQRVHAMYRQGTLFRCEACGFTARSLTKVAIHVSMNQYRVIETMESWPSG